MLQERILWGFIALCLMLPLTECGEPTTTVGSGVDTPKQACLQANPLQRDATQLENDLRTGSDADASVYLDEAQALAKNLASLLASGKALSGSVDNDLAAALQPVMRIESDLLKPDLTQAQADADTLRNAMIQLAMDCSPFLSP